MINAYIAHTYLKRRYDSQFKSSNLRLLIKLLQCTFKGHSIGQDIPFIIHIDILFATFEQEFRSSEFSNKEYLTIHV